MNWNMKLVATLLALCITPSAFAGLILALDDLGTPGIDVIVIDDVDGGVGDATPLGAATHADTLVSAPFGDGGVSYSGAVGGFGFSMSTGFSKPITGSRDMIHLDSVEMSGPAGAIRILITDTGFTSPSSRAVLRIGGVAAGTVEATGYVDDSDTPFGMDTVLSTGVMGPGSFSTSVDAGLSGPSGPYSMTLDILVTHPGAVWGFDVTSFDAEIVVPEPSVVAMLGVGLVAMGMIRRRRYMGR